MNEMRLAYNDLSCKAEADRAFRQRYILSIPKYRGTEVPWEIETIAKRFTDAQNEIDQLKSQLSSARDEHVYLNHLGSSLLHFFRFDVCRVTLSLSVWVLFVFLRKITK